MDRRDTMKKNQSKISTRGTLTYQQAYNIATQQMRNIDACVEYENAYMFKRKAENHSIGGHGFCIVLKESGQVLNQTEYMDQYATEIVREFDVSEKE